MHPGEILGSVAVLFVVVALAGVWFSIYNGLIAIKNAIARSWANIDVLLKQRHDELPKLVKTCEGYMQHERAVFDKLSEARGALLRAQSVGQRAEAENLLTKALGQVFAVAEAYPDLKANQGFLQLQGRISEIETQIADRREYYNDTVATFNTRLGQIPDKWVAGWLNLVSADLFHAEPADREDVDIQFKMAS
jgi:LemA protein